MNCAPGRRVDARVARDLPRPVQGRDPRGAARSASWRRTTRSTACRRTPDRWLLRDVLRSEWGFTGFVVSDYYAIWELSDRPDTHGHHVAARQEAKRALLAVRAGVNIEAPEPDCYLASRRARARRHARRVASWTISWRRCCYWKFKMGLFDDPYVDPDRSRARGRIRSQSRRWRDARRARRSRCSRTTGERAAARRRATIESIAVIGPERRTAVCSAATAAVRNTTSPCSTGSRRASASTRRFVYAEGCKITHRRIVERGRR